jgi:hypothetical protein
MQTVGCLPVDKPKMKTLFVIALLIGSAYAIPVDNGVEGWFLFSHNLVENLICYVFFLQLFSANSYRVYVKCRIFVAFPFKPHAV